jgi:hypothetical protein
MLVISVGSMVATVTLSNSNMQASFALRSDKEQFSELDTRSKELESLYLQMVLNHLEPKAEAAGFVAVSEPHYLASDTVVGFLTP